MILFLQRTTPFGHPTISCFQNTSAHKSTNHRHFSLLSSITHPSTHPFAVEILHYADRSVQRSFIGSFLHSFILLFFHSFITSSIYSSTLLYIHPSSNSLFTYTSPFCFHSSIHLTHHQYSLHLSLYPFSFNFLLSISQFLLFIPPSNHPFIHPTTHSFIPQSTHLFIHPSTYLFIHRLIHPSIHLSIHPLTHPSLHPPIHPHTHLSVFPFIHF